MIILHITCRGSSQGALSPGCTQPPPPHTPQLQSHFCTCLLPLAKPRRLHLCHWSLYSSSVTKHSTDPIKRGLRRRTQPHIVLSLESASCPRHLPPFCFLSLSNTEINIGYLLGVVRGSQEVGKPGPRSPAICRCVTQIHMALHYLGPQFWFVTLPACGESVIVHFMTMNGTAWRCSHSYSHLPPDDINPTPHYTPFFFMHVSFRKDKERQGHQKNRQIRVEMEE